MRRRKGEKNKGEASLGITSRDCSKSPWGHYPHELQYFSGVASNDKLAVTAWKDTYPVRFSGWYTKPPIHDRSKPQQRELEGIQTTTTPIEAQDARPADLVQEKVAQRLLRQRCRPPFFFVHISHATSRWNV